MKPSSRTVICLLGDYSPTVTAHVAIPKALDLAAERMGAGRGLAYEWLATEDLADDRVPDQLKEYAALWCVPASPYKNMRGVVRAIRYFRERSLPFLGTCGGYQHAVLEYAINALGISDAESSEVNPNARSAVIVPLSCTMVEKGEPLHVAKDSQLRAIYGRATADETYHCSYGFNLDFLPAFRNGHMRFTVWNAAHEPRAMELAGHPFFIGTAFQPERSSLRDEGHPIISSFVAAALGRRAPFG